MKRNTTKRVLACVLSVLTVAAYLPANAGTGGLSGSPAIVANAEGTVSFDSTTGTLTLAGEITADDVKEYQYRQDVTSVVAEKGAVLPAICDGLFYDFTSVEQIDLSNADASKVTSMKFMFYDCPNVERIDLSNVDASNVTSMMAMFGWCIALKTLEFGNLKTTNVEDMESMFCGCRSLEILDISSFDTSQVINTTDMFAACRKLTTIYVGDGWTTKSVSDLPMMFAGCNNLKGGAGTTYDSAHTDKEYARIDGGEEAPGYLTKKASAPVYEKVEAVPATYEESGNIEYYTDEDGNKYTLADGVYTPVTDEDVTIPKLEVFMQLSAVQAEGGNVDVNIYAELPEDAEPENCTISFGDTKKTADECEHVTLQNGRECYLIRVAAPAKCMRDSYQYSVKNGDDVLKSGETSVRHYAETVINADYADKYKKICRAMLAYGSAAQTYFDYNTGNLADADISGEGSDYSGVSVPEMTFSKTALNTALADAPVEYYGMSMILDCDTYIKLAFKVKKGYTQEQAVSYLNENFTFGGTAVSAEENANKNYVTIKSGAVTIENLMDDIALVYGGTEYSVNAAQYMNLAIAGTNNNLKNVCKALYHYYLAATGK